MFFSPLLTDAGQTDTSWLNGVSRQREIRCTTESMREEKEREREREKERKDKQRDEYAFD